MTYLGTAMDMYTSALDVVQESMQEAFARLSEVRQMEVEAHRKEIKQLRQTLRESLAQQKLRAESLQLGALEAEEVMEVEADFSEDIAEEFSAILDAAEKSDDWDTARPQVNSTAELASSVHMIRPSPGMSSDEQDSRIPHAKYFSPPPVVVEAPNAVALPPVEAKWKEFQVAAEHKEQPLPPKRENTTLTFSRSSSKTTATQREKQAQADMIRRELEKYQTPAQRRLRRVNAFTQEGDRDRRKLKKDWTLERVVEHPLFDTVFAVAIVANSFLVGYDVEWKTTHDTSEPWVEYSSYACSLFFAIELFCRMWAGGRLFFTGDTYLWSLFDTLLVIISIVDFFFSSFSEPGTTTTGSVEWSSGVKTVKMLRIARIFRVFRFFKELSLLALMILDSMKSLMWALMMLSIILYVFAIVFTQSATEFIKTEHISRDVSSQQKFFGNIMSTTYTLLQAMLGGISWGVCSDALFAIDWFPAGLFFFYIFFTILAFLNITTGVFVDNAVETARTQRDFLVQKEVELKERYLNEMRALFMEMDQDRSGTVNLDEVNMYFQDPRVQTYFAALGLDSADTERLFNLLDRDGDGDVSIDEFLQGCLRLKGLARSIDVHHLLMEVKKFNKRPSFDGRQPTRAQRSIRMSHDLESLATTHHIPTRSDGGL